MANTFTANASLPKPIDESQLFQDLENLQSAHNTAMDTIEAVLSGVQPVTVNAVNASVINVAGKASVAIQVLSAGCIATIIGQITGRPFTLIFQSVGSIGMADAGVFKLAGAFNPTLDDTITLVWDGTNFFEIARSAN